MSELDLIQIRRELHQIPEPGFEELKTQAYLLWQLSSMQVPHMEVETWQTGIFVRFQGYDANKTIAWRTDMDGLPMNENTNYEFASLHEGYMHACGHDIHMTIALGLCEQFAQAQPKDHVLVLFQPAEEGPGGAEPMMKAEPFQRWYPDEIYALHIAPELSEGTVATRPGLLFANTSELFIDFVGQAGHAAYPHQANDMVVTASHFVTQLQSIVSRNVDPLDSAVVTIGLIQGGTKQNIIAGEARIEGTIRTMSAEAMRKVKERIQQMLQGAEASFTCRTKVDWGATYEQVYNNHELAEDFLSFSEQSEDVHSYACREAMTGEDFGYFLKDIPGLMFWLGADSPYGLHDARLTPVEEAIHNGVHHTAAYLKHRMNT
ncbi:N-acetyldiaminopimelate deacetylase [Salsuginibacillus halophilus]|uniref:N-acetyldiaminopimelate deacetylase n=1 Tax=Salsuginibacillus halophilus TaxID=517424 RepID=A0A2P8HX91_9BACI|nr:N-acetyldiaminopimelate deacetylase [Salsuginibacillus halophilus]PSL50863.1 N-acetyldiaminopimelate deacetylase [Salsuginibacillus halophilus]